MGGKAGAADVVRALDAGADEYVTKPLSGDEVAARVRALMRRSTPIPSVVLSLENVTLNIITSLLGVRHPDKRVLIQGAGYGLPFTADDLRLRKLVKAESASVCPGRQLCGFKLHSARRMDR